MKRFWYAVCLIVCLAIASIVVASPNTNYSRISGLISLWNGESTPNDVVSGNNGVLQGGVTFVQAEVGEGFQFNGNGGVKIPFSENLGTNTWSVSAFVKPLSRMDEYQEVIFGQAFGRAQLLLHPGTTGLHVGWQFLTVDGFSPIFDSNSEIPIGAFTHITATRDNSKLKIYINGTFDSELTVENEVYQSTCPYYIGGFPPFDIEGCGYWDGGQYFNGIIDEVQFYNRALTSEEILSKYSNIQVNNLVNTVTQLNLSAGIANSLTQLLQNAINSLNTGNNRAAINQLNAFINIVNAQRGRAISEQDANRLVNAATQIINSISAQ